MSCPMYIDFTRECIKKFKSILNIGNYDICGSNDGYKDCIFYKTIKYPDDACKYRDKCIGLHIKADVSKMKIDIDILNSMGKQYCFNENRTNCAIYKKFKSGEEPSALLTPDGTMIELKE